MGTAYLRTDAQTLWARNAARNRSRGPEDVATPAVEVSVSPCTKELCSVGEQAYVGQAGL